MHRIGRTGRAGREGRALTFFTPREHGRLRRIEKLTGTEMEEVDIPSPAAVSEFRARRLLEGLAARIERGRLDMYKGLLADMGEESSVEDIAAALMATAVGDEGPAPRREKDRRGNGKIRSEERLDESGEFVGASFEAGRDKDRPLKGGANGARRRGGGRPAPGSGTRYRIEVGKKDRVKPGSIVGAIAGEGGIDGRDIGNIEIYPTFSLVDITADLSGEQLSRISKGYVSGRQLRIRVDEGPGARGERDGFERRERRDFDRDSRGRGGFGGERDGRYGDREARSGERDEKRPHRFEKGDGSRPRRSVRTERWEKDIKRARRDREGTRDGWERDGGREGGRRHFGKRRYND